LAQDLAIQGGARDAQAGATAGSSRRATTNPSVTRPVFATAVPTSCGDSTGGASCTCPGAGAGPCATSRATATTSTRACGHATASASGSLQHDFCFCGSAYE
jgi:hypothetical protein